MNSIICMAKMSFRLGQLGGVVETSVVGFEVGVSDVVLAQPVKKSTKN